jgi:cell division septation protein DedD
VISRAVALVCAAALAAGCSSNGSDSALSDSAAATLHSDVLALTRAAAARNWSAADGALTELRSDLAAARELGTVSDARAAAIETTIRSVAADLALSSGRTASSSAVRSSSPASSKASSPTASPTHTTAKPAPAPKPAPGPGGGGKDDKGPGKKHKG